jgi:hypothetical protein
VSVEIGWIEMAEKVENQEVEETEEELEEGNETQESTEETPSVEDLLKERDELKRSLDKANKERARLGRKVKETKETPEAPAISDAAKRVLVVSALKAEGLTQSQASRLARLYDLSEVDIEDDEVIGIDFDDLREEFPQLFEKSEPASTRKTVRQVDTGNKKTVTPSGNLSNATKEMLGL